MVHHLFLLLVFIYFCLIVQTAPFMWKKVKLFRQKNEGGEHIYIYIYVRIYIESNKKCRLQQIICWFQGRTLSRASDV